MKALWQNSPKVNNNQQEAQGVIYTQFLCNCLSCLYKDHLFILRFGFIGFYYQQSLRNHFPSWMGFLPHLQPHNWTAPHQVQPPPFLPVSQGRFVQPKPSLGVFLSTSTNVSHPPHAHRGLGKPKLLLFIHFSRCHGSPALWSCPHRPASSQVESGWDESIWGWTFARHFLSASLSVRTTQNRLLTTYFFPLVPNSIPWNCCWKSRPLS